MIMSIKVIDAGDPACTLPSVGYGYSVGNTPPVIGEGEANVACRLYECPPYSSMSCGSICLLSAKVELAQLVANVTHPLCKAALLVASAARDFFPHQYLIYYV